MAMSLEQANYCDRLKTGNVEVALLGCDVISGSNPINDLNEHEIGYINFIADMNAIEQESVIDSFAFIASKVVNTKLREMINS